MSGPAGNHRIGTEVYEKLKNNELTIEDERIIGAGLFIAKRLLRVLKYFFGTAEFHISRLIELQLKLSDIEEFTKYRKLSKKMGSDAPKAG